MKTKAKPKGSPKGQDLRGKAKARAKDHSRRLLVSPKLLRCGRREMST